MKLSELRPCDRCRGPVGLVFSIVRTSLAVVNQKAAREVVGTAGILGGLSNPGALRVAEALAPQAEAVVIAGEKDPNLWSELVLCLACANDPDASLPELAALAEARQEAAEAAKTEGRR